MKKNEKQQEDISRIYEIGLNKISKAIEVSDARLKKLDHKEDLKVMMK